MVVATLVHVLAEVVRGAHLAQRSVSVVLGSHLSKLVIVLTCELLNHVSSRRVVSVGRLCSNCL